MARRSARQSEILAKASVSSAVNESATRKRRRSSADDTDATPQAPRAQKRTKTLQRDSSKSRFFKQTKADIVDDEDEQSHEEDASDSSATDAESDFDAADGDPSGMTPEDESDDDDDEFSSADEKPKRKRKSLPKPSAAKKTGSSSQSTARVEGAELWREGAKIDLEPGTEIIIKRPKVRTAGKTPYADDTIHPNTLLFLGDLKANNDREWLKGLGSHCPWKAEHASTICRPRLSFRILW